MNKSNLLLARAARSRGYTDETHTMANATLRYRQAQGPDSRILILIKR
jgi:hypothetical protein